MFVFWLFERPLLQQIYSTTLTSKMHSGKYVSVKYTDSIVTESGAVELHGFMSWLGFTTTTSHLLHSAVIFFYCPFMVTFQSHITNHDCCWFLCAFFSPQSHLCKQQALHFKNLDILVTILQSFQLQKKVKISAIKLIYST